MAEMYNPARIALAHDYLTQKGGAERVALEIANAFPGSRLFTLSYEPSRTFAGFKNVMVNPVSWLNRFRIIRNDPRIAFPILALGVRSLGVIEADILLASSSGWAHGLRTSGKKVVYCHNPARWLYQPRSYFNSVPPFIRILIRVLLHPWRWWDCRAARSVDLYLANSYNVAERISMVYGRTAQVVHPPAGLSPQGPQKIVEGLPAEFYLTVSRSRGYKRSGVLVAAFTGSSRMLVQVGGSPTNSPNVIRLSNLGDEEMRWLYSNTRALLAVGDEDFGLTPVEAYGFGTPAVVLAAGGYLESASPETTVFISEASVNSVELALDEFESRTFIRSDIMLHGEKWSSEAFSNKIRSIVAGVLE